MSNSPASCPAHLESAAPKQIVIAGARVHNLQDVSLKIPLGRWSVITGVSGSGKSSLAIDTIHAEGQRRYFETLSSSARLFLQQLERPDVDRIEHLPPSIAIGQSNRTRSGNSHVGEATELIDSLAILAMRTGKMFCPQCNAPVTAFDASSLAQRIARLPERTRFQITFPLETEEKISIAEQRQKWEREGFHRFIDLKPDQSSLNSLVLVDRLVAGNTPPERLQESFGQAFSVGQNCVVLLIDPSVSFSEQSQPGSLIVQDESEREWILEFYPQENCCRCCHQQYPEIQTPLFKRSSPIGACPDCSGTGLVKENKQSRSCQTCLGLGLNELARMVQLAHIPMQELMRYRSDDLLEFLQQSTETLKQLNGNSVEVIQDLCMRLETLRRLGLGYLQPARRLTSLSNGEYRRVSLVNALCSRLVNALYIFDEPSAGLHQHDCRAVLEAIKNLRDQDNTVIMVEHNVEMLSQVDHLIELGPAAGQQGGRILYEGDLSTFRKQADSCTANWLRGEAPVAKFIHRPIDKQTPFLIATGVCCRNVQQATVKFPLQHLSVITGVSGSGKTSLLCDTIFPILNAQLTQSDRIEQDQPENACKAQLSGYESIAESVLVNDVVVNRSIRSTPITYIKAFDEIRKLFANSADAQKLGFQATRFSFNSSAGGRCTHCQGVGLLEIDMHFLANHSVLCPECKGKRFNQETLSVKYRGRNIHDVLSMTIDEAFEFFHNHQTIQRRLQMLREVGLGYLRAGQSLSTLSGGESQRLKLASFLTESSGQSKLYLFDEPTAGLHPQDTATLISCFRRLVEKGHTVIAIDHHTLMFNAADWVVDLGPGAADQGGKILFAGLPQDLVNCKESITAKHVMKSS